MCILKEYLLNENIKIRNYICNLNIENLNNKLFQKKIEYISFYIKNTLEELEELNEINNYDLFYNKNYIENEYNKYLNMETYIKNQLIQSR
jgi:hypothetical protein